MHTKTGSEPRHRAVLTIGFIAATIAVLAAYTAPATGYEISIYRSTPPLFWVGIAIGLASALYVALVANEWHRAVDGALGLATYCVVAVVALPVLRSYYFYGGGDSMSHLGWAKEIRTGILGPDELLYPSIHLMSVYLAELTPLEPAFGLKLVPLVLFPIVFVVGMALCVGLVTSSQWGTIVGVLSALLYVPINHISLHFMAHPSSQAILLLPLVVYLMFQFITDDGSGFPLTTPSGAAFLLVGLGLVFLHPQETMIFLVMLSAIVLLQAVVRRFPNSRVGDAGSVRAIADHRPIYLHTFVIGIVFVVWTIQHERARQRTAYVLESVLGGSAVVFEETVERGASLAQLGGSYEELFVKLFAVATFFCLVGGVLVAVNLLGRLDGTKPRRNAFISYLGIGLAPVLAVFFVILVADQGDHYFRMLGFILVSLTILGAAGLTELLGSLETRASERTSRLNRTHLFTAVAVVFVVFFAMQLAVVHDSPYVYQGNQQVTEADMNGYEIAIEYHDGETQLMALRGGPTRFIDAHFGMDTARKDLDFPGYRAGVDEDVFDQNVTTHYDDDRYLVVRETNRVNELELYDELRYSSDGFETLETDARVNRVQHNGGFELYRIQGGE